MHKETVIIMSGKFKLFFVGTNGTDTVIVGPEYYPRRHWVSVLRGSTPGKLVGIP